VKLRPRRKRSWFPKILQEGSRERNPFPSVKWWETRKTTEEDIVPWGENLPGEAQESKRREELTGHRAPHAPARTDTKITGRIIILSQLNRQFHSN